MHIVHRSIRTISLFCLLVLAACSTSAAHSPTVGAPAPALELPQLGGGSVSLDALRGQVVVVNFWATWCPPCVEETPRLVGWHEQYADQGLAVLGVDTLYQDSRDEVEKFATEYKVSYPVLLDEEGDMSKRWEARQLPRSYVIDRDGVVRYVRIGELTDADFEAQVLPLLQDAAS